MNYYFKNLCQYPAHAVIPATHLYDNIKKEHDSGKPLMPHLYYSLYVNGDLAKPSDVYTKTTLETSSRGLNSLEEYFYKNKCIIIRPCVNEINACDIYNYSCFMCTNAPLIVYTKDTPADIIAKIADAKHVLSMKRSPDYHIKHKCVSLPEINDAPDVSCVIYKTHNVKYIVTDDYDEHAVYVSDHVYDDNQESMLFKFPYVYDIVYPTGDIYYMNSVRDMANNNFFYFPSYAFAKQHMPINNEQLGDVANIMLTLDLTIPGTTDLTTYNVTRMKSKKYYSILYLHTYLSSSDPTKYTYTHHTIDDYTKCKLTKLFIDKESRLSIVSKDDFMTAWNNIAFNDSFYIIAHDLFNIDIPENILTDVTDTFTSGFKVCDNTEVNNIVVNYIDEIGDKYGIYCAGGACLSMLKNTPIKDIDLFAIKNVDMEAVKVHLINYLNPNEEIWDITYTETRWLYNFSITHKSTGIRLELQFVLGKHASLYHIIGTFDLSPCKVIYANKRFLTIKNSRFDTPNIAYIHIGYLNSARQVKERLLKYANEKKYDIYMLKGIANLSNINEDKLHKINNGDSIQVTHFKKEKTADILYIDPGRYILTQKLCGSEVKYKVINDYHIPSLFLYVSDNI